MGFMNRFSDLFRSEEDFELDEAYEGEEEETVEEAAPVAAPAAKSAPASKSTGSISSGASLEMKVVKPERFDEVQMIGEHLLARRTVVLNLEDTNKETTKRIIDFLGGVVFAIQGKVRKVANATYVVTPKNVEVSSEQAEQPVEEVPAAAKPRDLFN
ncbi:MAG: cell division protein SepF [Ruminococcaceae bacterium]|nr:cell division protein SepF [Oscillospiraceae bacterium]